MSKQMNKHMKHMTQIGHMEHMTTWPDAWPLLEWESPTLLSRLTSRRGSSQAVDWAASSRELACRCRQNACDALSISCSFPPCLSSPCICALWSHCSKAFATFRWAGVSNSKFAPWMSSPTGSRLPCLHSARMASAPPCWRCTAV
jgi:hypothetical protein